MTNLLELKDAQSVRVSRPSLLVHLQMKIFAKTIFLVSILLSDQRTIERISFLKGRDFRSIPNPEYASDRPANHKQSVKCAAIGRFIPCTPFPDL